MTSKYAFLLVLMHLAAAPASSQQTHVLLDDAKALVTQIELSAGQTYTVPEGQAGTVWTALDPVVLLETKGEQQNQKRVHAGDAATVSAGEHIGFRAGRGLPVRLVLVKPKTTQQELTVESFVLTGSLEDASGRNATLLIAISNSRFRDTRNLGDESEWKPGKPDTITMRSGSVRWILPGIHHFKNLGSTAARLVSIEW
jgi:quercetin dioxygenase-like cupin family protein